MEADLFDELVLRVSKRGIIALRSLLDTEEPWMVVFIPEGIDTGFRLNMTLSDQEVEHWKRLNG